MILLNTSSGLSVLNKSSKPHAQIGRGGIFQTFHHAVFEIPDPAIFFETRKAKCLAQRQFANEERIGLPERDKIIRDVARPFLAREVQV